MVSQCFTHVYIDMYRCYELDVCHWWCGEIELDEERRLNDCVALCVCGIMRTRGKCRHGGVG